MAWGVAAQAIGDIAGRFIGGGETAGKASARQYYYNNLLQQQAQAWNEKAYKHRYQWQVEDLEKAGINKLYGLGNAPAITTGANSVGLEDDQGAKNGRMSNIIAMMGQAQNWSAQQVQNEKIKQETLTEQQNTNLKMYEALTKEQESIEKQINNKYLDEQKKAELDRTLQEIQTLKSQATNNLASANYQMKTMNSVINANNAQAQNARASASYQNAMTENTKAGTAYTNEIAKAQTEFLKKHPNMRGIIAGANAMSGMFGQIATGAGVGIAGYGAKTARINANNKKRK